MSGPPNQPGVKLEMVEQSLQVSWMAVGVLAMIVLVGAALLVWMFSGGRRDD